MDNKEPKTKNLESRLEANRRYYAKNKEKVRMQGYFRTAKTWINNTDDLDKLSELINLANSRISDLKGSN